MSNIKNFGIQGINSDVQYGKGGGRLVFANGTFSFIAAPTGSTLARLEIADPQGPTDAVTLGVMKSTIDHVYAKVDKTSAAVDTQLAAMKTAISTLVLDEITGGNYSAKTSTTGFAVTGTASATAFNLDLSSANEAVLSATSTSGNTTLRLVPQGTGGVVIGDGSTDGLIQPEGGHNLTIAGGDAATAGSVIIRAGQGTTNGHVEIHDLLDPQAPQDPATKAYTDSVVAALTATVTSLTTTTMSLTSELNSTTASISNWTTSLSTQISALTTNINALTSTASTQGSLISSVQSDVSTLSATVANNASAGQKYTDTAIANVISGSLRTLVASFTEVSGDHVLGMIPASTILRAKVLIETAFTAGATIALTTPQGTLVAASAIDEAQPGLYTVELFNAVPSSDVTVSITTTGTAGTGMIALEYAPN